MIGPLRKGRLLGKVARVRGQSSLEQRLQELAGFPLPLEAMKFPSTQWPLSN